MWLQKYKQILLLLIIPFFFSGCVEITTPGKIYAFNFLDGFLILIGLEIGNFLYKTLFIDYILLFMVVFVINKIIKMVIQMSKGEELEVNKAGQMLWKTILLGVVGTFLLLPMKMEVVAYSSNLKLIEILQANQVGGNVAPLSNFVEKATAASVITPDSKPGTFSNTNKALFGDKSIKEMVGPSSLLKFDGEVKVPMIVGATVSFVDFILYSPTYGIIPKTFGSYFDTLISSPDKIILQIWTGSGNKLAENVNNAVVNTDSTIKTSYTLLAMNNWALGNIAQEINYLTYKLALESGGIAVAENTPAKMEKNYVTADELADQENYKLFSKYLSDNKYKELNDFLMADVSGILGNTITSVNEGTPQLNPIEPNVFSNLKIPQTKLEIKNNVPNIEMKDPTDFAKLTNGYYKKYELKSTGGLPDITKKTGLFFNGVEPDTVINTYRENLPQKYISEIATIKTFCGEIKCNSASSTPSVTTPTTFINTAKLQFSSNIANDIFQELKTHSSNIITKCIAEMGTTSDMQKLNTCKDNYIDAIVKYRYGPLAMKSETPSTTYNLGEQSKIITTLNETQTKIISLQNVLNTDLTSYLPKDSGATGFDPKKKQQETKSNIGIIFATWEKQKNEQLSELETNVKSQLQAMISMVLVPTPVNTQQIASSDEGTRNLMTLVPYGGFSLNLWSWGNAGATLLALVHFLLALLVNIIVSVLIYVMAYFFYGIYTMHSLGIALAFIVAPLSYITSVIKGEFTDVLKPFKNVLSFRLWDVGILIVVIICTTLTPLIITMAQKVGGDIKGIGPLISGFILIGWLVGIFLLLSYFIKTIQKAFGLEQDGMSGAFGQFGKAAGMLAAGGVVGGGLKVGAAGLKGQLQGAKIAGAHGIQGVNALKNKISPYEPPTAFRSKLNNWAGQNTLGAQTKAGVDAVKEKGTNLWDKVWNGKSNATTSTTPAASSTASSIINPTNIALGAAGAIGAAASGIGSPSGDTPSES